MPSFLVSFITPGGQLELTHGSHVVNLPESPPTARAVMDLQASIAMEYGTKSAALLNWDFLPDSSIHPGGAGPYCYFLTYASASEHGARFGSITLLRSEPIRTLADLRYVEEGLRSEFQYREVHLVSCKALKEPTQELLQGYEQVRRSTKLE